MYLIKVLKRRGMLVLVLFSNTYFWQLPFSGTTTKLNLTIVLVAAEWPENNVSYQSIEIGASLRIEDVGQPKSLEPLNLIKAIFLDDKRYAKHPRGRWNLGCLSGPGSIGNPIFLPWQTLFLK